MARKDLIRTTASIGGVPIGEFKTFTGGELTSGDVKSVNGGGQVERARGGRQTISNVVIGREDDGSITLKSYAPLRGKAGMVVTRTPLDDDGNARSAEAITYTGKLMAIRPGEADAESDNDLDSFELEMSCDSVVS